MSIEWAVPSWRRAEGLTTHEYAPWATVWVAESELEAYRAANPEARVEAMPDEWQGHGKGRAMNWLLDRLWGGGAEGVVFLDDDVTDMARYVIREDKRVRAEAVESETFREIVENHVRLAAEWGIGLMSYNLNHYDPLTYSEFCPFKHHSYLDGGLQGFALDDGLRYDEALTVKEDVDMMLQQLRLHRRVLRVDRYYLRKRSFEGAGGCQSFRSAEVEQEQFRAMQRKWGKSVIRPNPPKRGADSTIRGLGGAIKLNLPFRGA